jgi:2,4-dichlorophenol 6-monooxygenase
MIETDVLIVGSGPSGSTAALALSTYGISNVLVTKHRWLADTPRAHVTNQRTFEILRDLGVEAEARAFAVPQEEIENIVFCTSLAGEEWARILGMGNHPMRRADYSLSSPCGMADLPQNLLEPVLLGNAAGRGTRVRFDTEYLSLVQNEDGVTANLQDRLSGDTYQIRAKYLIGADGGHSRVAEDIGLPMEGSMALAGSMNIRWRRHWCSSHDTPLERMDAYQGIRSQPRRAKVDRRGGNTDQIHVIVDGEQLVRHPL